MSFTDIIKNSVLEKFQNGGITTSSIIITLCMSIVLGIFIYFVYRLNTKSGFYNKDFNKSLAILPVITAAIMLAMGSSITISLGMVGALSIVRFRNAVKNPIDLTYLFWSIGMGIVIGAGLFELGIILSLAITALLIGLDLLPAFKAPCLLVVSGTDIDIEQNLLDIAKKYTRFIKIRSRNVTKNGVEWILEMKIKDEAKMVENISALEQITSVHLMTHDGDVRF